MRSSKLSVSFQLFKRLSLLRAGLIRQYDRVLGRLVGGAMKSIHGGRISYVDVGALRAENVPRWTAREARGASLTIVVVTYKMPDALNCLLSSLECQTLQNFDVIVLHDGADDATRKIATERPSARRVLLRYIETDVRHNDYGHSLRDAGIAQASGDFLLITNGDNYYPPRFVEYVFDAIETHRLDMAIWNLVHSHADPGGLRATSYTPFSTFPVAWRIDIGSMLVRTTIAKRVGFRDKSHDGDTTYLNDVLEHGGSLRIGKVDKTLMVHN